jgi:hypothetical protein
MAGRFKGPKEKIFTRSPGVSLGIYFLVYTGTTITSTKEIVVSDG